MATEKKPVRKRASAVRKKTLIEKRPTAKQKTLKAVPEPKQVRVNPRAPHKYQKFTLKQIAHYERMHPNHNAAVNALTEAFAAGKRLAVVDEGVPLSKFPNIWLAMSDYIELDGSVIKDTFNNIGVK